MLFQQERQEGVRGYSEDAHYGCMLFGRDRFTQRECAANKFYVLLSVQDIYFVESVDGEVELTIVTYRPIP
jgi:hypothetical protein